MQKQQGDVLFHGVDAIPSGAKPVKARGGMFILAEGEATGHAHRVEAAPEVQLFERDGVLYLDTKKNVSVGHEEHKTVKLPPGKYEVGRVVEFDPLANEVRRVAD